MLLTLRFLVRCSERPLFPENLSRIQWYHR